MRAGGCGLLGPQPSPASPPAAWTPGFCGGNRGIKCAFSTGMRAQAVRHGLAGPAEVLTPCVQSALQVLGVRCGSKADNNISAAIKHASQSHLRGKSGKVAKGCPNPAQLRSGGKERTA